MGIRSRLIFSYLAVTLGLCLGFVVVMHYFVMGKITRLHLQSARAGVQQIAEKNYQLSKKVLTENGERVVELRARIAVLRIQELLRPYDRPLDYDRLRSDKKLRAVATESIHAHGKAAGYIDVYDRKGVAVLHPNRAVEGHNFAEWKD